MVKTNARASSEKKRKSEDLADAADLPTSPLARLRLLVALDALLVEGSVSQAAARLDLGAPAMSRLLSQIRAIYDDPIVIRTGKGMLPTPLAEKLRQRLRALSAEAEALIDPSNIRAEPEQGAGFGPEEARRPILQAPPLAMRPTVLLEGQPLPEDFARRLAAIDENAEPKHRLARHIATIGAGAGRSRPLTTDEAEDAFRIILEGEADPTQIGALLVAMHYRGITADELAGLVASSRRHAGALPLGSGAVDLDWPAYLSPRMSSPPWFLLAARLVAQAGHRVLLHGFGHGMGQVSTALGLAGIPQCLSMEEARETLRSQTIAFLPLSAIDPQLQALVGLYSLFEMRSPLNLLVHLINPLGAPASLLGVATASSRHLHRDAAAMLGWPRLMAVTTNRDVAQATPFRAMRLACLTGNEPRDVVVPAIQESRVRSGSRTGFSSLEYWHGVWTGAVRDERATATIVATAALGFMAIDGSELPYEEAHGRASKAWTGRTMKAG
ncbi:glycosyl transferase family protein [Aquamicrobium sp. LC103]|uniref:glycosyl transferase family protein n=1 Tax=Aquamicrobium sp. LC103 TaxID=1120658 RepID=UPI000699A771|nr:glycosyl transferase family protein [Aquamicrobium sp. LC103]TKT69696.1 glycosyl transferase family protein [Aquamicrobium sp. LC103]